MSTTTALPCTESTASAASLAPSLNRVGLLARMLAFAELTKPRIAVLELVVVFVAAMICGSSPPAGWVLLNTLVGTALVASSASAFNQLRERHVDALMPRTSTRPMPSGIVQPWEAVGFGAVLGLVGAVQLALFVNLTVALLGVLCWCLYVLIYTPLKQRSPANTVIGAIAGAIPALMGAASASPLGLPALALFMVLYLWQFPHFMAIAWLYRDDYAAGGMKMLTVVDRSGRRAANQSLAGALAIIPISWVPLLGVPAGNLYLLGATALGVAQAAFAFHFFARRDDNSARWLLRASLVYLPAVLILLLLGPIL